MTVSELIEILEFYEPDANVYLMVQPNYPFEHAVNAVKQRGEWYREDETEEPWGDRHDRWGAGEGQLPSSDVFLLDGGQLRYGAKDAFGSM